MRQDSLLRRRDYGVYGYYDVLKTAGDPQDPEHDEMVEWLGEYNPE